MEVPKEYEYTYPDEIFNNIDVLTAESVEQELYMDMLGSNPALGRGELESIAVCMNRSAIFATLDEKAIRFAKTRSIHVLHLHTVLKMLLKTAIPVVPINACSQRVDSLYFRKHLRTMLMRKKDNSK